MQEAREQRRGHHDDRVEEDAGERAVDERRGRRRLDVAAAVNERLPRSRLLDLLDEEENGPGERDDPEVPRLQQACKDEQREQGRKLSTSHADRHPTGVAQDAAFELERRRRYAGLRRNV